LLEQNPKMILVHSDYIHETWRLSGVKPKNTTYKILKVAGT